MERKRKNFGYITAKIHGGKLGQKTIAIHFKPGDTQAIKMARGILQAIEYRKDISITIFKDKQLRNGCNPITITSQK